MHKVKFIAHMSILAVAMLVISIAIKVNYYSLLVTWALFAYIIVKELIDYFKARRERSRCIQWPIVFTFHHFKIKGNNMEFQLHEDEVLPFRLGKPINSEGGEAPIEDGSFKDAVADPNIFTVEQDDEQPDDPEAKMFVPHAVGETTYDGEADADLGSGVEKITFSIKGTIIAAGAVGFAPITLGAARKKKAAPQG